jgi:hypothetical protein
MRKLAFLFSRNQKILLSGNYFSKELKLLINMCNKIHFYTNIPTTFLCTYHNVTY